VLGEGEGVERELVRDEGIGRGRRSRGWLGHVVLFFVMDAQLVNSLVG